MLEFWNYELSMINMRKIFFVIRKRSFFASLLLISIGLNFWLINIFFQRVVWQMTAFQTDQPSSDSGQTFVHGMRPAIIFLHAPKAGGSFINSILSQWCQATHRLCVRAYEKRLDLLVRTFKQMNASEKNNIDLIYGHIPFGIHRMIELRRPIKFFTILRDPVRQAVSAFHYMRRQRHHLGRSYALQAAVRNLNNTFHSEVIFSNHTAAVSQMIPHRNQVIGLLTWNRSSFSNLKACFSSDNGSEEWNSLHRLSVEHFWSMDTSSLIKFADKILNQAWKANCTTPLNPFLTKSFDQFLIDNLYSNSSVDDVPLLWDFGNNPTTAIFCCHHSWFAHTVRNEQTEHDSKSACIRDAKTLNCALNNMKRIDLILINEQMDLSLRLLEKFLNWTIPMHFRQARVNEAVYVPPAPPSIASGELLLAERLAKLDRIIYQTGVLKFYSSVHAHNILPTAI